MPTLEVTRTYLEMSSPDQLRPARSDDDSVRLAQVGRCPASFFRYLYAAVGERYHWVDRNAWSDAQVRAHLDAGDTTLWVLYSAGAPAGYFELKRWADGSVEIAYFGLLPEYHGRGLGKHLLTLAVEHAWALGAGRVWLHTCTLDHVAALPNYLARGFRPFKEERYTIEAPRSAGASP
jgi:GNAT superfamily N-acetyltransferase